MNYFQHRKQIAQHAMVTRAANAIRAEYGEDMPVRTMAVLISQCTEAEMLQVPNIGKKALKLIKAWLAIHHMELYHG
jgi:DNA-directed RNA polymerase alpha subunit